MMQLYSSLEQTGLSIWLRESDWGFFFPLILHSLAMGVVVGINLAVSLRVLGVAPGVPLSRLARFYPLMWWGALTILLSGLLLLLAYPAKALTNPVFYLKLACIAGALAIALYFLKKWMSGRVSDAGELPVSVRVLGALSLVLWVLGVGAGRFLAYTHSVLLASSFY